MSLIDKSDTHPLSHRDGKLRCVCVDSETKVINHNYREDTRSGRLYREGNMISGQRGRGNNWALGYHGLNGETEEMSLLHRAMETVRKEIERCDNYAGTIVVHSLTGGTGSGLGSRLVERIRDAYPLAHVMSVAVSPHSSGDSPLQHYNSLLSLSSLQRHADGVLLFSNDDVLHQITAHTGLLSRQKPSGSISLRDMNSYISASLAGVLQPLGNKPRCLKGKLRETGFKRGVDVTDDKKERKKINKREEILSKTDTISKKLSFSLDESWDKSDVRHYKSEFGRTLRSATASSVMSDDHFVDTSSCASEVGAYTEMTRQPRSTASALLRYRGIVNPSSSETQTSKSDTCLSSQLAAGVSSGNEPWEMLRSVCAEPSKKFATVHHIAKSKASWESLTQSLVHSIRRYDRQGMPFSTICSLLVARGDHEGSFAEVWTKIEDKLRNSLSCVEWNPFPVDFWISQYNPAGPKDSQSLTLCLNSTKIVETLEDVMLKARAMYDAGAYLHWFWKHGCSKSDFMDAFDTLDSVVEEYKLAVR